MNFAYYTYTLVSTCLFALLFPPFWLYSHLTGRYRKGFKQRLGVYQDRLLRKVTGSPRIWLHAASVGEVKTAESIIETLRISIPGCGFILSTMTEQGQAMALDKLGGSVTCIYAPIDFIFSVRLAMSAIKPDLLVLLETEIWPNLLREAARRGVKTALVNGRISIRSFDGYLKARPVINEALRHINTFSMISDHDAERIARLGAPKDKIAVNGNAKYDRLSKQVSHTLSARMKRRYNIGESLPVFLAGSIRSQEESIVLDVFKRIYKRYPEVLLIIAPRHLERVRAIKNLAEENGFSFQLRTDLKRPDCQRTEPVLIIDTIGELQDIYSIASIVFCGGSLAPLGGQNILEAAAWGKPVLYGPSMEDFLDAKSLLEKTGGGIQVENGDDLAEKALYYLSRPEEASLIGEQARQAVLLNKGSGGKHAGVVLELLSRDGG